MFSVVTKFVVTNERLRALLFVSAVPKKQRHHLGEISASENGSVPSVFIWRVSERDLHLARSLPGTDDLDPSTLKI